MSVVASEKTIIEESEWTGTDDMGTGLGVHGGTHDKDQETERNSDSGSTDRENDTAENSERQSPGTSTS